MFDWIFILISSTFAPFIFFYNHFYNKPFRLLECFALSIPVGVALSSIASFLLGMLFHIYFSQEHAIIINIIFFTLSLIQVMLKRPIAKDDKRYFEMFKNEQKRRKMMNEKIKKENSEENSEAKIQNNNKQVRTRKIFFETRIISEIVNEAFDNILYLLSTLFLSTLFYYLFSIHFLDPVPSGRGTALNCYGDLPFHENIISSFTHGANYHWQGLTSLKTLFFYGESFVYPFIPDFHTALLVGAGGASVRTSLIITSMMMIFSFITLLYFFNLRIFEKEETAVISVFLFLFSGGLGFLDFIRKLFSTGDTELHLFDYVQKIDHGKIYYFFNPIDSTLIPQRTALFGYPLVLGVLIWVWTAVYVNPTRTSFGSYVRAFAGAGFLTGILPLIHVHSFAAVAFITILVCLFFIPFSFSPSRWGKYIGSWGVYGISANILALPQLYGYFTRATGKNFVRFHPVWRNVGESPFMYLFNALGFLLLFSLIGIILLNHKQLRFYLASLLLAVVCVLVMFQPWKFDNIKIINVWLFMGSGVAANFIVWIGSRFSDSQGIIRTILSGMVISIAVTFFIVCIFSGVLSTVRLPLKTSELHTHNDIEIAHWIKYNTDPNSVFIMDNNYHATPVTALAGRQIVCGNDGWLWTHGISYTKTDSKKKESLRVLENCESYGKAKWINDVFDQFNVSYVYFNNYHRLHQKTLDIVGLVPVFSLDHVTIYKRIRKN